MNSDIEQEDCIQNKILKGGTHTSIPNSPFPFCVLCFSFIVGTLQMSVDKGPTVPAPDAGFFGRVPLKGTLPFFHWYLQE